MMESIWLFLPFGISTNNLPRPNLSPLKYLIKWPLHYETQALFFLLADSFIQSFAKRFITEILQKDSNICLQLNHIYKSLFALKFFNVNNLFKHSTMKSDNLMEKSQDYGSEFAQMEVPPEFQINRNEGEKIY